MATESTSAPERKACLDCGTPLHGEWCHACGQRDVDPQASVWAVLGEFVQESLEIDGRLPRTLLPFLFHPGFLAREFLEGRRRRYTSPVRLYLFAALVSFFMLQYTATRAVQGKDLVVSSSGVKIDRSRDEPPLPEESGASIVPADSGPPALDLEDSSSVLPERYQGMSRDAVARSLVADFFGWAPFGAAVLLLIYALLLELFYRSLPFLTHLVGSTHVHAFGLIAFGIAALTGQGLALPISLAVIQIYVLASLFVTYRQRWWVTLLKWFGLSFVYWLLASAVFVGVFLAATSAG